MDHRYMAWFRACRAPAAATLSVALLSQSSVAETADPAMPGVHHALHFMRVTQLPRYSASGRHECGSGGDAKRSCIVSGLFSDCNEADPVSQRPVGYPQILRSVARYALDPGNADRLWDTSVRLLS